MNAAWWWTGLEFRVARMRHEKKKEEMSKCIPVLLKKDCQHISLTIKQSFRDKKKKVHEQGNIRVIS
jgi:hypothetical protein